MLVDLAVMVCVCVVLWLVFFFNYTATTEIYTYVHTLSLHDALPIFLHVARAFAAGRPEVEAAGFVGCHAGPQIGAQLRQGAAFPGAPVGLDEPRLRLYRAAAQNCRGIAGAGQRAAQPARAGGLRRQ